MYDYPYRLETDRGYNGEVRYVVMRTGEGVVCEGDNFNEMRRLVDAANEVALQEHGDRGR